MLKRRLVNRYLMAAVIAVPTALFGIYTLTFAQDPPSAAFPSEASQRPILRIAQADQQPAAGGMDTAAWDVPGGVALDPKVKQWKSAGVTACTGCHEKTGEKAAIPALRNRKLDDGWCLLNELITWGSMDKHYGAYEVLKSERSKRMAKVLDVMDNGESVIHRDQRCLACHTGMPIHEMGEIKDGLVSAELTQNERLNLGVSCEGCHGVSAKADILSDVQGWLDPHDEDGWRTLSPKIKAEKFGFYDVRSPVSRTRMCASCHIGNAKEGRVVTHEMYAAGHPPLPGFELETFCDQEPEHWRNFRHKPQMIKDAFLEGTKEWRTYDWSMDEAEDTRDLLIAACVSLSEYVKLNVDLSTEGFQFPIQSPKYSEQNWPEFAQFACYACHHDLQAEGWRIKRPPVGTPGRPPMYEWPTALVQVAMKTAKVGADQGKAVHSLVLEVQKALVDGPFGNAGELRKKAAILTKELDAIATKLENEPLSKADAREVLNSITEVSQAQDWDYDSARQLAWAYRIAYEEFKGTSPKVQDLYNTQNKSLSDVPAWYDSTSELDPVQKELESFKKLMLMSLREGRVVDEQGNDTLPFLEWDAKSALNPIGEYHPDRFKDKMRALQGMGKNQTSRTDANRSAN